MAKKRQAISLETKIALLDYKEKNPSATHDKLKEKFGLASRKTVTDILAKKDKYRAANHTDIQRKKIRDCVYPELDKAVKMWVTQMKSNNVILTDSLIMTKALCFAVSLGINTEDKKGFFASEGWLQCFKIRHGIKSLRRHGEAKKVPHQDLHGFRRELQDVIKNYTLADVFNCDETGLYFRITPNKTIAQSAENIYNNDKTRITILLTCNANGSEKLKPVVIGTAAQPRSYLNIDMKKLPHVKYFNHSNAWMNGKIFKTWILDLNRHFQIQNRKILLLVDNAGPHSVHEYEDQLTNIKVSYLPQNTASHLQPTNAGIITNFKIRYRSRYIEHLLKKYETTGEHPFTEKTKFTLRQGINMLVDAWDDVKSETILRCWQRTGILPDRDNCMDIISLVNEDCVDAFIQVDRLLGKIPQNGIHYTMNAEAYLEIDVSLPVIECLTDDEIIAEVDPRQIHLGAVKQEVCEESDEEAPELVSWREMQEAADILLAGLEEKASEFDQAEEVYMLLRRFKRFILSSKSSANSHTSIDFLNSDLSKGKICV